MERTKIALVGCAGWSKSKIQPAIEKVPELQVVACTSRPENPAPAQEAAARFGAKFCPSLEDVLAMDEVEAVVMVTPNHVHLPQAELAFAAGKHVFMEKPIANTVAEGIEMVRAAERHKRILFVGHNTRRRESVRLAYQYAKEGRIGQIVSMESHFSHDGAKRLEANSWRQDPQKAPGLPLMQLGIHSIDIMNMFFGVPREVASFHRRAVLPRNVDNTVSIVAYDEPVVTTLASTYVVPLIGWLRLLGTEGTIEAGDFYRKFTCLRLNAEPEIKEFPKDVSPLDEMQDLARVLREGAPVETDGRWAVYALATVEACIKSAQERRVVSIREIVGDFQ
jgi:predicted dehydrogenase